MADALDYGVMPLDKACKHCGLTEKDQYIPGLERPGMELYKQGKADEATMLGQWLEELEADASGQAKRILSDLRARIKKKEHYK